MILSNVTLMWARLKEPVTNYNEDGKEWQVTAMITEEQKDEMEGLKINKNFKLDEESGLYGVKLTQSQFSRDGKAMSISVVDKYGDDVTASVGNGSVGHIKIFMMEGQGKSKGKTNIRLNAVQVIDLIEYIPEADFTVIAKPEVSITDESPY